MVERLPLLALVQVSAALLFKIIPLLAQNVVVSSPDFSLGGSSSSYSGQFSTDYFQTFSSSYPSGGQFSVNQQQSGVNQNPNFEFLSPQGLRITVPGPYPASSIYLLKFHINVNHDFNSGLKTGDWNGETTVPSGSIWSYTFPEIRLSQGDIIYYLVEVKGAQGARTWFRDYKGFYQLPQSISHGSIPSPGFVEIQRPSQSVQPQPLPATVTGNGNVNPNFFQKPLGGSSPDIPEATFNYFTPLEVDKGNIPERCQLSTTTFNNGRRPCVGQSLTNNVVFSKIQQIAGNNPEEKFTVFSKDNVMRNRNIDTIWPTLLEDKYGADFVDKSLSLPDCTAQNRDLCSANAMGYFILPPIISGRESTENAFSFRYGVLEVTAKLPSGDWIVPELWLLPKSNIYGNSSGRVVLAMARGNGVLSDGVEDYSSMVLEAGVQLETEQQMFRKTQSRPWSSNYHKYKLVWLPDEMQFFVDNQEIGRVQPGESGLLPSQRGSKLAPFDQEFYLVFGVHVGGDNDFSDSLLDKPWKNTEPKDKLKFWSARKQWQPTWSGDTALHISGFTLTALDF